MFRTSARCFCAFCRSERFVYKKRHVSVVDAFLGAAASLLMSFILWQDFDPRAVAMFAVSLGLAEVFIILRWRLSITCPHCGFDPVVYKKDHEAAAKKVKAHMDKRRQDPLSVFAPPPKLPKIKKKPEPQAPVRGRSVDTRL